LMGKTNAGPAGFGRKSAAGGLSRFSSRALVGRKSAAGGLSRFSSRALVGRKSAAVASAALVREP
jgi:hypothetical protein